MTTGSGSGGTAKATRLSGATLVAALVVLLLFAAFVLYMIAQVGADEVRWARLGWLFGTVEALAFGAAGALFGSSIQRERAVKAEESARKNADAAANGRALARAVVADEPAAAAGSGGLESLGPAERGGAAAVASAHARLARSLFPDLD